MVRLDPDDFATRTEWVAADLRRRLGEGEWGIGERLPSEHQFIDQYGVSRATVRSALQILDSGGLVQTRRGSGTYALGKQREVSADLRALESMTHTIERHGMRPMSDYHLIEFRPASTEQAKRLELDDAEIVLNTARAIRADGEVVAYSFESIPQRLLGPEFDIGDIPNSLFDLLASSGATPTMSQTEVAASRADERFRHLVDDDALFLRLDQIHRDRQGRAVVLSSSYYLEGRFNFVLARTR